VQENECTPEAHQMQTPPFFDILEAIPDFRISSTLLPHSIRASAVGAQLVVLSMTLQKYFSHPSLII